MFVSFHGVEGSETGGDGAGGGEGALRTVIKQYYGSVKKRFLFYLLTCLSQYCAYSLLIFLFLLMCLCSTFIVL